MGLLLFFVAVACACTLTCTTGVDETMAIQSFLSNSSCSTVELFGDCKTMPLVVSSGFRRSLLVRGTLKAARKWSDQPLLTVTAVNQFYLGGGGTIDGQGHLWWTGNNTTPGRPILLLMDGKNVVVENLHLLNAAFYHMYVTGSL